MWRCASLGACLLGGVGFLGGITLCLHFRLPIPPLFITELGILLGGCFGAMAALTVPASSVSIDDEWSEISSLR